MSEPEHRGHWQNVARWNTRAVKVSISDYHCLDLDAPVLSAHEVLVDGRVLWRVWCKHCDAYHYHGPAEGHRIAHCREPDSPYLDTGYNLALSTP